MEAVHKVCHYLKKRDFSLGNTPTGEQTKCNECPAKEKTQHGGGTKMCRLLAQECMNVALWGNPWGEKCRHSKAQWPKRKSSLK